MATVYVVQRTTDNLYHSVTGMYEADLALAKFMTKEGARTVVKRWHKAGSRDWQVVAVDLVAQPWDAKLNDF